MGFNFKTCLFSKVENNSSVVIIAFPLCPSKTRYELKFRTVFILCPENGVACFRIVFDGSLDKIFQI